MRVNRTDTVNACPHQFLPLNHRGAQVMSVDGKTIRCTNHSAGFDAATGDGTEGLGQGCALVPIPIRQIGENIVIDGGVTIRMYE